MKNSLGYFFSFKESQKTGNNIVVKFISGISYTFPKKYQNKKDFSCSVVNQGDYSPLYVELHEFKTIYKKEAKYNDKNFFNSLEDLSYLFNSKKEFWQYFLFYWTAAFFLTYKIDCDIYNHYGIEKCKYDSFLSALALKYQKELEKTFN